MTARARSNSFSPSFVAVVVVVAAVAATVACAAIRSHPSELSRIAAPVVCRCRPLARSHSSPLSRAVSYRLVASRCPDPSRPVDPLSRCPDPSRPADPACPHLSALRLWRTKATQKGEDVTGRPCPRYSPVYSSFSLFFSHAYACMLSVVNLSPPVCSLPFCPLAARCPLALAWHFAFARCTLRQPPSFNSFPRPLVPRLASARAGHTWFRIPDSALGPVPARDGRDDPRIRGFRGSPSH